MERYDYFEEVRKSAEDYALELMEHGWTGDAEDLEERCWVCDAVTGNASGSFFFNAWKSEEAICHNFDLLAGALSEFGTDSSEALERGAEWCDVSIRCYVLPQIADSAFRIARRRFENETEAET